MFKKILISSISSILLSATAQAAITSGQLIAIGSLNGSTAGVNADLSGLTNTLENGVAANFLGGMGSGLAYAGGNSFIATPDRGPNATVYNSAIDDTTSYISRFHTISMDLVANTSGSGLAYNLTPTLNATTLLSSSTALNYGSGVDLGNKIGGVTPIGSGAPDLNATNNTYYFTGRSDNYGSANPITGIADSTSANPSNGRFDPEGVRVSNDGLSVFVSDEYGPYVNQFNRITGERIKSFALPSNLAVANLSPVGAVEIFNNTSNGRVTNKGMEGLAITPDGTKLVGVMQAALGQDGGKSVRIVTIDIESGSTNEYAYKLTTGSGVSEIIAINNHEFLIDERDGKGLGDGTTAVVKQLYKIDLAGATDVSSLTGSVALGNAAVTKTLFLDVVTELNAHGITSANVPAKIEAMAFGPDITDNGALFHTLYVANDNDFIPGVAGDNQFYVFAIADTALNYQAQQISAVPVPAAVWLFGTGIISLFGFARQRKTV